MKKYTLCARGGVSIAALIFSVAAHAQSGGAGAGGSGAQVNAANEVGEIVVTANKRNENVSKVGLSIAVLSAQTLNERRITTLENIASVVPGLTFALSGTGTPILTLRGVGFNESSLGVYPAVSVYIDQAPLPFPVLSARSAYDLERVEVLKGPQGTLFGQNSTGGAINLIAAKPTRHFDMGGDMSFGRFNAVEGNFHVSGPITDTLRGRLAITGAHSDDWQYSATSDRTLGHTSYVAGRMLLDWDATDALKMSLNINGSRDESQPQAAQLIGIRVQGWSPTRALYHQALLNPVFSDGNPRIADWAGIQLDPATGATSASAPYAFGPMSTWKLADFTPYSNRRQFQGALRADYHFENGITLTSLTSYDWYDQKQRTDDSGSSLVLNTLQKNDGYIKSFNQEVRLANDPKSAIRWVIGGNYESSITYEDQIIRYTDIANDSPDLDFINGSGTTNKQNIKNYAFFGNLEYDVTSKLTLKGAARYTDSSIKSSICGYTAPGGNVYHLFNYLGGLLSSVPFAPIGENDCFTLNSTYTPGAPITGELKQHNVSWRGGVDYKVTPDILLYANVSRGYKAGSYPTLSASTYIADKPVSQEQVTAYEVGYKAALFDRKLRLTGAAFYDDYRDKQVRGRLLDPVFGALETLVNIPKSRIMGLEADATANVAPGLTLDASGTYLSSRIDTGPAAPYNYNILGLVDSFSGDKLPFTPKWSGTFNADYRFQTGKGYNPFMGFTVTAVSSQDSTPGGSKLNYFANRGPGGSEAGVPVFLAPGVKNPYIINGHATVDLRAGIESANKQWRIMIWGKNVFNKYYWNNVVTGTDSVARQAGMPATYGVTVSMHL